MAVCISQHCGPNVQDVVWYQVCASCTPSDGGGGASQTEQAEYDVVVVPGSVPAGAKSITITNQSLTVTATVDGTPLGPGMHVSWSATPGFVLDAVAYDPSVGGSLTIVTVT